MAKHIEDYVKSLQELTAAQSLIIGDLLYFCDVDSPHRSALEAFYATLQDLNRNKTSHIINRLRDQLLNPVREHLAEGPAMREVMDKRARKKMDMDFFKQRLIKVMDNPEKRAAAEEKLRPAVELYEQVTNALMQRFSQVEIMAENVCFTALPVLYDAQKSWYHSGNLVYESYETTMQKLFEETRRHAAEQGIDLSQLWSDLAKHQQYRQFQVGKTTAAMLSSSSGSTSASGTSTLAGSDSSSVANLSLQIAPNGMIGNPEENQDLLIHKALLHALKDTGCEPLMPARIPSLTDPLCPKYPNAPYYPANAAVSFEVLHKKYAPGPFLSQQGVLPEVKDSEPVHGSDHQLSGPLLPFVAGACRRAVPRSFRMSLLHGFQGGATRAIPSPSVSGETASTAAARGRTPAVSVSLGTQSQNQGEAQQPQSPYDIMAWQDEKLMEEAKAVFGQDDSQVRQSDRTGAGDDNEPVLSNEHIARLAAAAAAATLGVARSGPPPRRVAAPPQPTPTSPQPRSSASNAGAVPGVSPTTQCSSSPRESPSTNDSRDGISTPSLGAVEASVQAPSALSVDPPVTPSHQASGSVSGPASASGPTAPSQSSSGATPVATPTNLPLLPRKPAKPLTPSIAPSHIQVTIPQNLPLSPKLTPSSAAAAAAAAASRSTSASMSEIESQPSHSQATGMNSASTSESSTDSLAQEGTKQAAESTSDQPLQEQPNHKVTHSDHGDASVGTTTAMTRETSESNAGSETMETASSGSAHPLTLPVLEIVKVLHAYQAANERELSISPGEYVYVVQKTKSGWWRGFKTNMEYGFFPSNYALPPTAEEIASLPTLPGRDALGSPLYSTASPE